MVVIARIVVLVACVALVVLPAVAHRGESADAARQRRPGARERVLIGLMGVAYLLALLWATTPLLAAADYASHLGVTIAGAVAYAIGLFLLYRSHRDLSTQWSLTLETRDRHALVTHGLYRRIRHPMYLALILCGVGQVLALPNYVAGPAYLLAGLLLVVLRVGPEEQMMLATFGDRYREYAARTDRLLPGVW